MRQFEQLESRSLLTATLLADINEAPQPVETSITEFADGVLALEAHRHRGVAGLWSVDGAGEAELIVDIEVGASAVWGGRFRNDLLIMGETAIWVTDGTAEGTHRLASGISRYGPYVVMEDMIFFSASDDRGAELWRSDGTQEGTFRLKDIRPGREDAQIGEMVAMDGNVYFAADDGIHGAELWKSDGTEEGTTLVVDLAPARASSRPDKLFAANGALYFGASARGVIEFWVTGGTAESTRRLASYSPLNVQPFDDGFVFNTFDSNGEWLIVSVDPSSDQIESLYRAPGRIRWSQVVGPHILFEQGGALGVITGGSSGEPEFLVEARISRPFTDGDVAYFHVEDGISYWSDGVFSTAQLPPDAFVTSVVANEGMHFVVTTDGALFVVDTVSGSSRQIEMATGLTLGSFPSAVRVGDRWLISAKRLVEGAEDNSTVQSLWSTDGTPENTFLLAARLHSIVQTFDDRLVYFSDQQLMTTDGTLENTRQIAPDVFGVQTWGPDAPLTFATNNATSGLRELWLTDGTMEGTRRFYEGISPRVWEIGSGRFIHDVDPVTSRNVLWSTDANTAGLQRLFDSGGQLDGPYPIGDLFYVIAWAAGGGEHELWMTDGESTENTHLIGRRTGGSFILQEAGDGWLFTTMSGDEESGRSLWKTDGTREGTVRLHEDVDASVHVASIGDITFFAAADGALWRTNGEVDGTEIVRESVLMPSAGFIVAGTTLFGAATTLTADWDYVTTFWSSDGTPEGTKQIGGEYTSYRLAHHFDGGFYFFAQVEGERVVYRADADDIQPVEAASLLEFEESAGVAYLISGVDGCESARDSRPCVAHLSAAHGDGETRLHSEMTPFTQTPEFYESFLREANGVTYFATGGEEPGLWATDGTVEGTVRVANNITVSDVYDRAGVTWFTGAVDGRHEIWSTAGTVDSTVRLGPVSAGGFRFATHGGLTYFGSNDEGVVTLWSSDGTRNGPQPVHRFNTSNPSAYLDFPHGSHASMLLFELVDTRFRSELYGYAGDRAEPLQEIFKGNRVWQADVSEHGVLITGDDGLHGLEPWFFPFEPDRVAGDTDNSGVVDFVDFLTLSANFGKEVDAVWEEGDFNADGMVDFTDYLLLSENFVERHTE